MRSCRLNAHCKNDTRFGIDLNRWKKGSEKRDIYEHRGKKEEEIATKKKYEKPIKNGMRMNFIHAKGLI